jgi:hypothetical protein
LELCDLYSSPSIIRMIKWRRMRWAEHVAWMVEKMLSSSAQLHRVSYPCCSYYRYYYAITATTAVILMFPG